MRSIPTAAPSIDVIVRDLKTNCERDFGDARAMPPGVYTSPEFLEREQQTLFRNEWLCMGRASALPNPGDYLTAEIAGVALEQREAAGARWSTVQRQELEGQDLHSFAARLRGWEAGLLDRAEKLARRVKRL